MWRTLKSICVLFTAVFVKLWEREAGWIITVGWSTLSSNWQPIRLFLQFYSQFTFFYKYTIKCLVWQYPNVTIWKCDSVTMWKCDSVTVWQCDNVKEWQWSVTVRPTYSARKKTTIYAIYAWWQLSWCGGPGIFPPPRIPAIPCRKISGRRHTRNVPGLLPLLRTRPRLHRCNHCSCSKIVTVVKLVSV